MYMTFSKNIYLAIVSVNVDTLDGKDRVRTLNCGLVDTTDWLMQQLEQPHSSLRY